MARLIDANSILDDFLKRYTEMEKDGKLVFAACEIKQDFADMISNATTVDAVEVVRCRECKHFRHYGKTSLFINGKNIKAGWCQRRIRYDEECRMTADDFCSYGERKDGAD